MKKLIYAWFGMGLAFSSAHAVYSEYQQYSHQAIKGDGSYLRYMSKVNKEQIKTIF